MSFGTREERKLVRPGSGRSCDQLTEVLAVLYIEAKNQGHMGTSRGQYILGRILFIYFSYYRQSPKRGESHWRTTGIKPVFSEKFTYIHRIEAFGILCMSTMYE